MQRVREVVELGYKAFVLTVDAIVYGNRERDIRAPWVLDDLEKAGSKNEGVEAGDAVRQPGDQEAVEEEANLSGTAGALVGNDDRDMTWEKVGLRLFSRLHCTDAQTDNPVVKKAHDLAHHDQRHPKRSGKQEPVAIPLNFSKVLRRIAYWLLKQV